MSEGMFLTTAAHMTLTNVCYTNDHLTCIVLRNIPSKLDLPVPCQATFTFRSKESINVYLLLFLVVIVADATVPFAAGFDAVACIVDPQLELPFVANVESWQSFALAGSKICFIE